MNGINEMNLMTAKELAKYLNLPESRIRYETFLKRIPHIKFGRTVRYSKEAIDIWVSGLSMSPSTGSKDEMVSENEQ